jgi:hypothetical protein
VPLREALLDVADGLETEVPDEPAGEVGKTGQLRHVVLLAQRFDLGERVVEVAPFDDLAALLHFQLVPPQAVHAAGRQADDRMAPPGRAALDRLEQEGVRAIGQLEVHGQRRVEVRKDLAHQRDARVTLRGVSVELFAGDHGARGYWGDRRL